MVSALGHDVPGVFVLVFAIGSGLAGLAGVIGGFMLLTQPTLAHAIGPIVFVVVVVGGLGSLSGALIAMRFAMFPLFGLVGLVWALVWFAWFLHEKLSTVFTDPTTARLWQYGIFTAVILGFGLFLCLVDLFANLGNAGACWLYINDKALAIG